MSRPRSKRRDERKKRRVLLAGKLHPLAVELGDDWRWLSSTYSGTLVLLHENGAWFELPVDSLWHQGFAGWAAMARAMKDYGSRCWTGRAGLANMPDGTYHAVRLGRDPGPADDPPKEAS